jgi:hypothetical protein
MDQNIDQNIKKLTCELISILPIKIVFETVEDQFIHYFFKYDFENTKVFLFIFCNMMMNNYTLDELKNINFDKILYINLLIIGSDFLLDDLQDKIKVLNGKKTMEIKNEFYEYKKNGVEKSENYQKLMFGSIDFISIYLKINLFQTNKHDSFKNLIKTIQNKETKQRIILTQILSKFINILNNEEMKIFLKYFLPVINNVSSDPELTKLLMEPILFIPSKFIVVFDYDASLSFLKLSLFLCEKKELEMNLFGVRLFGYLCFLDRYVLLNYNIKLVFKKIITFIDYFKNNSKSKELILLCVQIIKLLN